MILSNISVPLLGMVDTGVTGHLDDAAYLGAVAVGSTIFGFLYAGFNFLRMGTTGISAQRFGANDIDGLKVSLGQALVVSLAIAATLILFQAPLGNIAMQVIGPDASVALFAQEYFSIRIWSAPATLANYVLIGWFLGLQNARVPLYIVLAINLTNIVLDLIFVLGFGMTVDGVALASVIAEFTGLAVGSLFVLRFFGKNPGHMIWSKLTTFSEYAAFFSVNLHLLVRTLALMFTFTFVTAAGARQGEVILAANAVLINLLNLLSFALDGLAHAAEALVGKAVGAWDRRGLKRSVQLTLRWSLWVSLAFVGFFYVTGPYIVRLLTDLPDIVSTAMEYLPWMIVMPVVAVWSYLYDGVFVGATRSKAMRDIMIVSSFLVFVPAWYAFRFLDNHGLWLALSLFLASRGVGMHWYYRRKMLPEFTA